MKVTVKEVNMNVKKRKKRKNIGIGLSSLFETTTGTHSGPFGKITVKTSLDKKEVK